MEEEKEITGAQMVLECLRRLDVTDIFGYPGGCVIPLYDAIYNQDRIKHYLVRHEQGAAHSADSYGRVSGGKPGVCLATSGPGATNLVTGIMTAHMDSTPMIAITGQVSRGLLGKDAFQESDIIGITMPITKMNYMVKRIGDIPIIFREAYHIATTGRPGPVLIDIPRDIQVGVISWAHFEELYEKPLELRGCSFANEGNVEKIQAVAQEIQKAKRPVIIAGAGVLKSRSTDFLRELVEKAKIPVTTSLLGLGALPTSHPLVLGMLGMHGTVAANSALHEADLLLALGMRFDDRITGNPQKFAPQAKIVHVDVDLAEINKNKNVDISIVGDLKKVLKQLVPLVSSCESGEWQQKVQGLKLISRDSRKRNQGDFLCPQVVLNRLNEVLKGQAIITTDVGQHQMWTAQILDFEEPNSFCSSGGSGTMGFGLPAAIGAQVARPDKLVVAVVGDGGFQMTMQELAMIKEYNLPVKIILMNNSYLGMVRQWQEIFHEGRYSCVDLSCSPNFIKLAEAYDIPAIQFTKSEDLDQLQEWIRREGPVLIECKIEKEANVFPMIPAGASFEEMIINQERG